MAVRTEEIVRKIRREIEAEAAGETADARPAAGTEGWTPIAERPELAYLNQHWLLDPIVEMRSHRRLLGPLVVRAKTVLRRLVLGILEGYLEKERRFLQELVRFDGALAERSDRLLREITDRTEAVAERNDLFLAALDLRLEALEAREQMRLGLAASDARPEGALAADEVLAAEMAADLFPGVAERLRPFLPLFRGRRRVLALGSGRGELLELLKAEGIQASGVEASPALVADSRARGIEASLASLPAHLESLPEGAIDGLIASHWAVRFGLALWPKIVGSARRALQPEGMALFEGVGDSRSAARLRWLLARQGFRDIDIRPCAGTGSQAGDEGADHVVVARKGEAA